MLSPVEMNTEGDRNEILLGFCLVLKFPFLNYLASELQQVSSSELSSRNVIRRVSDVRV